MLLFAPSRSSNLPILTKAATGHYHPGGIAWKKLRGANVHIKLMCTCRCIRDGRTVWYRRSSSPSSLSSPSEMEDSGRRKGRVRVCQAENFRSATLPTSLFLSAPHCSPPRHAEETSTTSISWRTESPSSATFRLTAMPVELKASSEVTAPAGRLLYCTQTQPSPSNTAECIGRSCHVFGVISSYQ